MEPSPRTVRLAGEDLPDHRHVCMLTDGPDEAYDVLLPFIVEGFEAGDRALHLVDPESRELHLERLKAGGIDVGSATASKQLEVETWTGTYLRKGHFDRAAQLSYVRKKLNEGRDLGYRLTRMIGFMEWSLDGETERELVAYEAGLDELLRKVPDAVVCAYDLNRHSARTIAHVLGLHPKALVGGVLRTNVAPARASARDRLLAAASELFHVAGVQATGVDSIIAAAGVAKATFYRHFPSKDDLVVAWLRDPRARWFDRVRASIESRGPESSEAIPMFFDAVADWLEADGYRGCPYLNTAAEITDPAHPARLVVVEFLQEVEDYLVGLADAAGYRDPRSLGQELQTLAAGAISLAVARRSGASVEAARRAALEVLASAERRPAAE
jgi:AcrR family transcriptional regulator